MQNLRWTTMFGLAAFAGLLVISCGKPPVVTPPQMPQLPQAAPAPPPLPPFQARLSLSASADVNPDAAGRPSPVVVRIYQLKDDAAFTAAEFFPLFDEEQKILSGPQLISRREIVMAPGARQTIDFEIALDAKFVGVVAAFRDIRNSQWRVIVPAGRRDLAITVEKMRVVLVPAGS